MVTDNPFPITLGVHELSRLIRREFAARTRHEGFTEGQWRTLWHLGRNQGLSQARLADILEMQPISLVRVLDRLESAGLIERRPDPRDRRAVQLYLTPAAGPIIDEMKRVSQEIHEDLRERIGPKDFDHLLRTLQRLRADFDAQPDVKVG